MKNKVTVKKHKKTIPTYIPKPAHELPMFFENKPYQGASGKIYPVPYSDGITDEKKMLIMMYIPLKMNTSKL